MTDEEREWMIQAVRDPGVLDDLNTGEGPVRLKNLATQSESADLPADRSLVGTLLGMPICYGGEHMGSFYLMEKEGGEGFTEEDENIAAMFAAQAASVISNARRHVETPRANVDLETLMDISPVAVSVFDTRSGEITYMNRESRRLLGAMEVADEEIENIYASLTFCRPDGREISFVDLPGTRTLQTGETVRADEVVVHLPSGKIISTLINCAPLFSASGEMVSVLSVIQDMTPLEDLDRKQVEFLGMVSEELRTPVIGIKGSVAALREVVEPVAATESLQLLRIIDQNADLMRSQINSLMELTQIETGRLSVATEATDLPGLIELSCREFLRDHSAIAIQRDIPARAAKSNGGQAAHWTGIAQFLTPGRETLQPVIARSRCLLLR